MSQEYGSDYRLARLQAYKLAKPSLPKDGKVSFAEFKQLEYLANTARTNQDALSEKPQVIKSALRLMSPESRAALWKKVKARSGKKSKSVPNSMDLEALFQGLTRRKRPIAEKEAEDEDDDDDIEIVNGEEVEPQEKESLSPSLRPAFFRELESSFKIAAKNPIPPDDLYQERFRQIREIFRLGDTESEILLCIHLIHSYHETRALSNLLGNIHTRLTHVGGALHARRDKQPIVMACSMMLGISLSEANSVLSDDSRLLQLGLLEEDLDPASGHSEFLEGRGKSPMRDRYFRIYPGPFLPLEAHTVSQEESTLVVELLRSHQEKTPLQILLHGLEGTGKTEFSRTLGLASAREVLDVGSNLESSMGDGIGESQSDSAFRYRMRALQAAAFHAEGKPSLLVLDEADTLLNWGEKGMLNRLLEQIKIPVIWISNSIAHVQPSTLRRFDYSIAFRKLGETQRKKIWDRVLEKHQADHLLPKFETEELARRFPAVAGGIELAVRNASALSKSGSKRYPAKVMARVLQSHGKLLDYQADYAVKSARSPTYSLEGLNIRGDIREILHTARSFNDHWKAQDYDSGTCNLSLLLYGPPGTGKTEFARYLARDLDRPLLVKRASDLLGPFVGLTEQLIREACEEAKEEGGILFLDEADSFLQSREGARNSWEITQVNELLSGMENMTGMLVCSTNFEGRLDPASRRRFHLKLEFGYLQGDGARHFWKVFFGGKTAKEPGEEFFRELCALPLLAPGDFKAVYERMKYFPKEEVEPEAVMGELRKEIGFKDGRAGRKMGL